MGTVILRMPEHEFWKCTPRKIHALIEIYNSMNSGTKREKEVKVTKENQKATIDAIAGW